MGRMLLRLVHCWKSLPICLFYRCSVTLADINDPLRSTPQALLGHGRLVLQPDKGEVRARVPPWLALWGSTNRRHKYFRPLYLARPLLPALSAAPLRAPLPARLFTGDRVPRDPRRHGAGGGEGSAARPRKGSQRFGPLPSPPLPGRGEALTLRTVRPARPMAPLEIDAY